MGVSFDEKCYIVWYLPKYSESMTAPIGFLSVRCCLHAFISKNLDFNLRQYGFDTPTYFKYLIKFQAHRFWARAFVDIHRISYFIHDEEKRSMSNNKKTVGNWRNVIQVRAFNLQLKWEAANNSHCKLKLQKHLGKKLLIAKKPAERNVNAIFKAKKCDSKKRTKNSTENTQMGRVKSEFLFHKVNHRAFVLVQCLLTSLWYSRIH